MTTNIDLRSDTVTLPTEPMRRAMHEAALGDDGLDGDPTVQKLEALAARLTGKEDALFVSSGTMGNLVATLTHGFGGGEAIVDEFAHIARSEAGGISHLARLMCNRIRSAGGEMDLDMVKTAIRPRLGKSGLPTAMVVIETSHNHSGGRVPSVQYMTELFGIAKAASVPVHMDGARSFNAAIALNVRIDDLAAFSDSMTFCLSKGLSAPMGSVLVGSRPFIERARTFRKMVGGGLRQAGCVAAAGLVALESMTERLADDHARATCLWRRLRNASEHLVDSEEPQTNIVLVNLTKDKLRSADKCVELLARQGLLVRARDPDTLRLVTHRHIDDQDAEAAADILIRELA